MIDQLTDSCIQTRLWSMPEPPPVRVMATKPRDGCIVIMAQLGSTGKSDSERYVAVCGTRDPSHVPESTRYCWVGCGKLCEASVCLWQDHGASWSLSLPLPTYLRCRIHSIASHIYAFLRPMAILCNFCRVVLIGLRVVYQPQNRSRSTSTRAEATYTNSTKWQSIV